MFVINGEHRIQVIPEMTPIGQSEDDGGDGPLLKKQRPIWCCFMKIAATSELTRGVVSRQKRVLTLFPFGYLIPLDADSSEPSKPEAYSCVNPLG
jgi:hypothetical protein